MNSLYQQMNQQQIGNNLGSIKQMMNNIRSSANPNAMLQSMMAKNPQLQQIMNFVRQSGGDPKTAFYNLAKQKGIDPQQILNMLK